MFCSISSKIAIYRLERFFLNIHFLIINKVISSGIIKRVSRIGHRYIISQRRYYQWSYDVFFPMTEKKKGLKKCGELKARDKLADVCG